MKELDDVIPLEIKGTITVYPQSYVDKLNKKIEKAKEIIKILLKCDRGQFFGNRRIYEKYMSTREQAEQFIKEIEK